jgi:hypothetical protein
MSEPYTEILENIAVNRLAPGARHELICERLHRCVQETIANFPGTRLLMPRTEIRLSRESTIRPDLALVATATNKLWLAAEIVSANDHQTDTVVKKQIYEDFKLPRLWMIDPRYDNIEVYHGTEFGLSLKGILAGRETLTEKLLPTFQLVVADLFKAD